MTEPRNVTMSHVLSIVDRLMANNPNSGLDVNNLPDFIGKLATVAYEGQRKLNELGSSTAVASVASPKMDEPIPAPAIEKVEKETLEVAAAPDEVAEAAPETTKKRGRANAPEAKAEAAPTQEAAVSEPVAAAAPKKMAKMRNVKKSPPKASVKPVEIEKPESYYELDKESRDTIDQLVKEHGDAQKAVRHLDATKRRGRKALWQKAIEEMAILEVQAAMRRADGVDVQALIAEANATNRTIEEISFERTGYKFAHISRVPFENMDPESAIKEDKIVCLIDGTARTMLGRYIAGEYGMTPEEYRIHFGLRADYPMSSSEYRDSKRQSAATHNLGKSRAKVKVDERKSAPVVEAPAQTARKTRKRAA